MSKPKIAKASMFVIGPCKNGCRNCGNVTVAIVNPETCRVGGHTISSAQLPLDQIPDLMASLFALQAKTRQVVQ